MGPQSGNIVQANRVNLLKGLLVTSASMATDQKFNVGSHVTSQRHQLLADAGIIGGIDEA
jgi:hypothetical protein